MNRPSIIAVALFSCVVVVTILWQWNQENQPIAGHSMPQHGVESRSDRRANRDPASTSAPDEAASSPQRTTRGPQSHESKFGASKQFSNTRDAAPESALTRTRSRSHKESAAGHAAAPNGNEPDTRDGAAEAASSTLGVRLAANVRLPAAAMPNDLKVTEVSRKALQDIVDDYYRELALGVVSEEEVTDPEMSPSQTGQVEVGDNGERTLIVTNGPVAETARKRADQRFRALFGNAAYNRLTMQAQMDLLMSADAAR